MIKVKRSLSAASAEICIFQNMEQLRTLKDRLFIYWEFIRDWVKQDDKDCPYHYFPTENIYLIHLSGSLPTTTDYVYCRQLDSIRQCGGQVLLSLKNMKKDVAVLNNLSGVDEYLYAIAEGMCLAGYDFTKYITTRKRGWRMKEIQVLSGQVSSSRIEELNAICSAVHLARDLVNEPPNVLTAEELAQRIKIMAKEARIRCQIYDKDKIEHLKMGGLLAVNKGSHLPPTFTILEHQPASPINRKPIVLVGKGVVYDTGGLSLKPTPDSMDKMKSDMAGAAVVAAIMKVIGTLDLPVHVVALIPATDNRPGYDAYTPGDIITMHSGQTVEVLNTDAEGRMILADALHFAKRYSPLWIADFATLTGSAWVAFGSNTMVYMGNAPQLLMDEFQHCGFKTNEKLAQVPFWDEYADSLKSHVADMKNIGGRSAGAITAGKFLEKFTDYPYIHFDIAGVSYADNASDYIPAGGTGTGVRMMSEFFIRLCGRQGRGKLPV